jgi:hypothetical protein
MPLNVGAVVWRDAVTVHPISLQLIGVAPLIDRPFGYCGNDFATARALPRGIVDSIEQTTLRIGDWLRSRGYLGVFGIDFLLVDGEPVFCELNARFQGSSRLSDRISTLLGRPTLAMEHMAAFLGLAHVPAAGGLWHLAQEVPPLAQAVFHNNGRDAAIDITKALDRSRVGNDIDAEAICPPSIVCANGGMLLRAVFESSLTSTGYGLELDSAAIVETVAKSIQEAAATT